MSRDSAAVALLLCPTNRKTISQLVGNFTCFRYDLVPRAVLDLDVISPLVPSVKKSSLSVSLRQVPIRRNVTNARECTGVNDQQQSRLTRTVCDTLARCLVLTQNQGALTVTHGITTLMYLRECTNTHAYHGSSST